MCSSDLEEKINLENFPYYNPESYNKDDYDTLCKTLNLWADFHIENKGYYKLKWVNENSDSEIFGKIISGKSTYTDRLLFWSQTIALREGVDLNSVAGMEWMRVIRNIVMSSTIDSLNRYKVALFIIEELSSGCKSIYKWLAYYNIESSSSFSNQISEEKIKSKLFILNNEKWKDIIFKCEDTELCKGKISFALKCIDYNNEPQSFNYCDFVKVYDVITKYMSDASLSLKRAFFQLTLNNFYLFWES